MATTQFTSSSGIEEKKIDIDGIGIHYCRNGKGNHVVLLIPGSIGATEDDYKQQLYYLDTEKFTIIVYHPPGLGKSRPPDRTYPDNFLERDAICAHNLMKTLGYSKYSLIGWLNGGSVALVIAAMFPDNIHKVVVSNAKVVIVDSDVESYNKLKNISNWAPARRDPLVAVYGEKYLEQIWTGLIEKMIEIYEKKDGDFCKSFLPSVKAPTLVMHGAQDKFVESIHANYIKDNIKNARIVILDKGNHNMHVQNYQEFNEIATQFLLEA